MPQVIIDGKPFDYEGKHKLLQFCIDNGIDVPYFCYHPEMSAPTNCRMCLVEVGFMQRDRETGQLVMGDDGQPKIMWGRKPATSCNQDLVPDMVVKTNQTSAVAEKAQKGVLEFMLINHPLDCPICDQAGECPLQINTYKFGPEGSRYELDKVHKPKRVELGPRVMLDAERCINCTRCVRFTEEISHSNQLTIIARGEKNFPAAAPGQQFDEPYSMNVIDLCPVGALTSASFRFKARAWEMSYTPGVCTGCSQGCNIDVWTRDNVVLRLTPRFNADINRYWMCDVGRLDIDKYNDQRVSGIKVKGDIPAPFEQGLAYTADLLQRHKGNILFVGSAHSSVESQHALKQLAASLGVDTVYYVQHHIAEKEDNFLAKADRTPNQAGAELVGFVAISEADLTEKARTAGLVYLAEDERVADILSPLFADVPFIVQARRYFANHEEAAVVLPAAESIEAPGTYINFKGIAQLTQQAKQIKQMTPEMWMGMSKSRIDAAGVAIDNWRHPENIVDAVPGWSLVSQLSAHLDGAVAYKTHKDAFEAIKATYPSLATLTLPKRNRKESFKQSQLEFAIGR